MLGLGFVLKSPSELRNRVEWLRRLKLAIAALGLSMEARHHDKREDEALQRLTIRLSEFRRTEEVRLQLARVAFRGFRPGAKSPKIEPVPRGSLRWAIEAGLIPLAETEWALEQLFGSARDVAELWAKFCQFEHDRTKNPMFAWSAYQVCHALKQPVQEWVYSYLDRVSLELARGCLVAPKNPASAFISALGAKRQGAGTVFSAFQKSLREFVLAQRVHELIPRVGNKKYIAWEEAGRPFGLGQEAVRIAYERYKPFFRSADTLHKSRGLF